MAGPRKRTAWLDCFTKLANRELRALYRARFANTVQMEIVLYILAQTRGTGKIMSGEVSRDIDEEGGEPFDVYQEALTTYGRKTAPLFRATIAASIQRHDRQVAKELRRLIAAGVVVEHEPGHKGKAAVLSVDLDPYHWRPSLLRAGVHPLPKSVDNSGASVDNSAGPGGNGSASAPEAGSVSAPESAVFGSASAPRFKRLKSETLRACSSEHETPNPRAASAASAIEEITTPAIKELARRPLED